MEQHKAIGMNEMEASHHKWVSETDYKEEIPGL